MFISRKFEELLRVFIDINKNGREVAATALQLLEILHCWQNHRLLFDTTLFISGIISRACIIIETLEKFLWRVWQHPIYEVVLKTNYKLFDPSLGPEVCLFKLFQEKWDLLDKTCAGTLIYEQPLDKSSESQTKNTKYRQGSYIWESSPKAGLTQTF